MKKGTFTLVFILATLFMSLGAVGVFVAHYDTTDDDTVVMESDVESVYVDTNETDESVPIDELDEDVLDGNTTDISLLDEEDEVIFDGENVDGAMTTNGTDITVTTYDGNSVEVDIDEAGGKVVFKHSALDDEMLDHADRGLCIAGLGGDESPLQIENKNGDAHFEISTDGEGQEFDDVSEQLESCDFSGLVSPSDLRSDRP